MLILIGMTLLFQNGWSQIEISEETQEEEPKVVSVDMRDNEVFLLANWSSTNRKLIENDAPFGDTLGYRADETKLNRWSYGLGIRSRLNEYLSWEGGISLLRNGETYRFEDTDTVYTYTTSYMYIGMPFKVLFTYGRRFRFYAGAGMIPQVFLQYRQEQGWLTSTGYGGENTVVTNNGYNTFVLSMVFNAGLQADLTKNMAVFIMPEYRHQLTSSYEKQDDYKHFSRALGLNMGLTYKLAE